MAEDYESLILTALPIVFMNAEYTNLPYAKDIYNLASRHAGHKKEGIIQLIKNAAKNNAYARSKISISEGRHIATNAALNDLSSSSILELSAGMSTRCLEYCDRKFYGDTDQPAIVSLKKSIIEQIASENGISLEYCHNLVLNPLNNKEILSFGNKYNSKFENDLVVVNSGLMMYLKDEEKKQLRDNFVQFLTIYSQKGHWITTDFSSRDFDDKDKTTNAVMKKVEEKTGRKFNRFKSDEQVNEFLSEGGLKGEPIPNEHLVEKLSCLDKVGIHFEDAMNLADRWRAWRVTIR